MIFILISTKKRKFGDHLTVHAPLLLRSCARLFVSCTTHTNIELLTSSSHLSPNSMSPTTSPDTSTSQLKMPRQPD